MTRTFYISGPDWRGPGGSAAWYVHATDENGTTRCLPSPDGTSWPSEDDARAAGIRFMLDAPREDDCPACGAAGMNCACVVVTVRR